MSAQIIAIETRRQIPMSCPTDEVLLLCAEETPAEYSAELEHLRSCAPCASRIAELRSTLTEWRATDLIDQRRFDAEYFSRLALDVDAALDRTARTAVVIVDGPRRWWRAPLPLAAALAAAVLVLLTLLSPSDPRPEAVIVMSDAPALEQMARALGKALLSDEAMDAADAEASLSLAAWNLDRHDPFNDIAPLPLTSTLSDEFALLDSESLASLVLRL